MFLGGLRQILYELVFITSHNVHSLRSLRLAPDMSLFDAFKKRVN